MKKRLDFPIRSVDVHALTIPTDKPESDGTLKWNKTTVVIVEVAAGDCKGLGLTYASNAAAEVIHETLRDHVLGKSALDIASCWREMHVAVRNIGRQGVAAMAISAVDFALWDVKAKLLNLPLHRLLGAVREEVPIYGSGGFTSYTFDELEEQTAGWVSAGIPRVKIKVGREPARDVARVRAVRQAIGKGTELFVDANGAYDLKQALKLGHLFSELGVSWFEEPVSSDDLNGLAFLRKALPASMEVAAGEYSFNEDYFLRMLTAGAVDVIQVDATRCGGVTGFLNVLAIADACHLPVSAHCAPSLHVALGCHSQSVRHIEYFHDHVRIEQMILDGIPTVHQGCLKPSGLRAGFGFELKNKKGLKLAA